MVKNFKILSISNLDRILCRIYFWEPLLCPLEIKPIFKIEGSTLKLLVTHPKESPLEFFNIFGSFLGSLPPLGWQTSIICACRHDLRVLVINEVNQSINKRGCVKAQIMELCQPSIKEITKIPRRSRKNSSGDAYWCAARTWRRNYRQNWSWQPIYFNIAEEAVKNHK